jgi:membrane-associated phospholipid phosphatase
MAPSEFDKSKATSAIDETSVYRPLLWRTVVALFVCGALVTISYGFIDRPVAFFVHDHDLPRFAIFRWLTYTAMVFEALAPTCILYMVVRLAWAPLTRLDHALLTAAISLMVAVTFEYYLKFLLGRYWPDTWIHHNPSLIRDGAYGFHPLHFGSSYGSFPSGHTARVFAVLSVFWIVYPRGRVVYALVCMSVMIGLVAMDYHFVGDTIGGAFLGSLTGVYAVQFSRINGTKGDT